MKKGNNITRYSYETTSFNGWRFAIQRDGSKLVKYFSAKRCGSVEKAYERAAQFRERVLKALATRKGNKVDILQSFKTEGRAA